MPVRPPRHKPVTRQAPRHQPQGSTAPSDTWREWYTHSRWRRIRAEHLRREPLCRFCGDKGRVTEATVVDHATPHRGDKGRFFSGPFISLCKTCHDSEKKRQENAAGAQELKPYDPVIA